MEIQQSVSLKAKTTMRIGGTAQWYLDLKTKEDAEAAVAFAKEKSVPLLPLGSGSNTIFNDGETKALVVRFQNDAVTIASEHLSSGAGRVTVESGKNLAMLINELAVQGLDLSALTGIPGTIGGAIFGNAGQGPKGIWLDSFVQSVTAYVDGTWKAFSKNECKFRYRESAFKDMNGSIPPIIWEVALTIPKGKPEAIKENIQALLKKRIETQPHLKTAGSCFKAIGETPAWKLIDAAGLRGFKVGGVEISPKHANFLMNVGEATFEDAVSVVKAVQEKIPENLEVEMRFITVDGGLEF